jgi:hypothetical protein
MIMRVLSLILFSWMPAFYIMSRTEMHILALPCGSSNKDPLGENAALYAATAKNGAFKPMTFEVEGKGGIVTQSQDLLDTQFGTPTSALYTGHQATPKIPRQLMVPSLACLQN